MSKVDVQLSAVRIPEPQLAVGTAPHGQGCRGQA